MPEKKHLRGASEKEQRQYEHILEGAKEEGRYGKRAKEVAARTVMKQHKEEGHDPHRAASPRGRKKTSTKRAGTKKPTGKTAERKPGGRKMTREEAGRKGGRATACKRAS